MEDYKLKNTVNRLEKEVDGLVREVHNLRQQQAGMFEQIKRLEELNNDGSGK